jgi:hypothetical protein
VAHPGAREEDHVREWQVAGGRHCDCEERGALISACSAQGRSWLWLNSR